MPLSHDPALADLAYILSKPRPACSERENTFVEHWLIPRIAALAAQHPDRYHTPQRDHADNIWLRSQTPTTTLITCHTDTVHHNDDDTQHIICANGRIQLADHSPSNCLGADDGAGIAIALAMIEAGKPYDFVFYREEEIGSIGSSTSARDNPEHYRPYQRAIAFDRRGTDDIITHQRWGETASTEFALALADMLNAAHPAFDYAPCEGVFTDTANLAHLIPECTNISVGYRWEHSPDETLDLTHWQNLRAALTSADCDFNRLPSYRDPRGACVPRVLGE